MVDSLALKRREVDEVALFLQRFNTRVAPRVGLGPSGNSLWVQNFPLPDWMRPDHVDLALVLDNFPYDPPKGLYLLTTATERALVAGLQRRFNVFQDMAVHGAPPIQGYEWVCFGFLDGWRYNIRAPHKGDNTAKMLAAFFAELQQVR